MGAIIVAVLGGLLGYYMGLKIYVNYEHEETIKAFEQYIKQVKQDRKKTGTKTALTTNLS